jgi:hypothetical protein
MMMTIIIVHGALLTMKQQMKSIEKQSKIFKKSEYFVYRKSLLRSMFITWKQSIKQNKRLKIYYNKLRFKTTFRFLIKSFKKWKICFRNENRGKLLAKKHNKLVSKKVFLIMKKALHKSLSIKFVAIRVLARKVKRSFKVWREETLKKKVERYQELTLSTCLSVFILFRLFRGWKQLT